MKNSGKSSEMPVSGVCTYCPFAQPCRDKVLSGYTRCEWSARIVRTKKVPVQKVLSAMKASMSAKALYASDDAVLVHGCTVCDYISKII